MKKQKQKQKPSPHEFLPKNKSKPPTVNGNLPSRSATRKQFKFGLNLKELIRTCREKVGVESELICQRHHGRNSASPQHGLEEVDACFSVPRLSRVLELASCRVSSYNASKNEQNSNKAYPAEQGRWYEAVG